MAERTLVMEGELIEIQPGPRLLDASVLLTKHNAVENKRFSGFYNGTG